LVDYPAAMNLTERRREADRQPQKVSDLHGRAEEPCKRLSARVLDQKHRPAAHLSEFHRPRSRFRVKVVSQREFVSETVERGSRRTTCGRNSEQNGADFVLADSHQSPTERAA